MVTISKFSSSAFKIAKNNVSFGNAQTNSVNEQQDNRPVVKSAINAVNGRIGTNLFRMMNADLNEYGTADSYERVLEKERKCPVKMELAAINVSKKMSDQGILEKFGNDSTLGPLRAKLSIRHDEETGERYLCVGNRAGTIKRESRIVEAREIKDLPWKKLKIDVVVDCTGQFLTKEKIGEHLKAGAQKAIMSAPAKDDTKQVVYGINDETVSPVDKILSAASCTTTCIAPVIKLLDDKFEVESGNIDTIHSSTASQQLTDKAPALEKESGASKLRSALDSMIPTTTGAAKAIGKVIPHLNGKLDADAVRVPVSNGSLAIITLKLKNPTSKEDVKTILSNASKSEQYKDLIGIGGNNFVSKDVLGRHESAVIAPNQTKVSPDGKTVKVYAFYDNEWGYTRSLLDLTRKAGAQIAEERTGEKLSTMA